MSQKGFLQTRMIVNLLIEMVDARYQIYEDKTGQYRFRLWAPNNKIVAVSEAYQTKENAFNGVHSVMKACDANVEDTTIGEALQNPKFQIFKDAAQKFRFRLRANNNEIVAASEAYESKANCIKGVKAVKKYCNAKVEDLTTGQVIEEKQLITPDINCQEPNLVLDPPPTQAPKGSWVTFTGKLICKDKGILGEKITIWEMDHSLMKDDYMGSGLTSETGTFSIDWRAKEMDWIDDTVEAYAKFEGTKTLGPAWSIKYVIKIT